MNTLKLSAVLIVTALIGSSILAGITYEGTNIIVSNYPAATPATLSDIRAANSNGGWGIVQYDSGTDTTTLTNHVVIGSAGGSNSFFQIGRTNFPAETLVLKGNLRVQTPSGSGQNGLMLGTGATNTVHPTLKFDCSTANEFGLYLDSGAIMASYNAVISGVTTNRTKQWIGVRASDNIQQLYLTNTVFLNGYLYPFDTLNGIVVNCTYANAAHAQRNAGYYQGCTFSNLDAALWDYGSLECTVVGCVFTNNAQNWTLDHTDRGIRAVDCRIGPPGNTNIVCQRYYYAGHWHYPSFMAQRHIVANVKDAGGNPITNAMVAVSNEQEDVSAILFGLVTTDTNGLTPAIDSERALFVMDYLYRATDAGTQYKTFTYTLTTTAPGYQTNQITGIDPDESWTVRDVILTP